MKPKRWYVVDWDICMYLHAMSDMGRSSSGEWSRPHTNNAECYAAQDGAKCPNQGHCIKARLRRRPE